MKTINIVAISVLLCMMFGVSGLESKVNIVTSYRYIADITERIGGEAVSVVALAKGNRDPHFITPKPSFIAKMRKADLLIINGGQLEIGWMPPIIRQSNNPNVKPGEAGFLDLMGLITPIDKHEHVSRAQGDIHPDGNPHFSLDPQHIPILAEGIAKKLCTLDADNCQKFEENLDRFKTQWEKKLALWDQRMAALRNTKVVQYHKLFDYFLKRYQIEAVTAIEPLPGIPPSAKHVGKVIETVKNKNVTVILQDVYHPKKAAKYIARKTGAKILVLPQDIGALKEVTDIFKLFDVITVRLSGK